MQHDLQLRAAARAHFIYDQLLGPHLFEDAEIRRSPAYLRAVEAAREESAAIDDLFTQQRQGSLFEDMMGMTPGEWDVLGS